MTQLALAVPLAQEPIVMVGATSEWSTTVAVEDPQMVSAVLKISASDRLDRQESTVSVRVDGVPIRTLSVAQLVQDGTHVIEFAVDDAGYHRIDVRSRLVIPGDPCLAEDPDAAWLVIESDSSISGVRGEGPSGSVAEAVSSWRQGTGVAVDTRGGGMAQAGVLMEVADWLVRRGTRPLEQGDGSLHLRDLMDVDIPPALRQQLALNSAADSAIGVVDGVVWIVGRDPETLTAGVWTLNQPGFVEACDQAVCSIGSQRASVDVSPHAQDASVWSGAVDWGPSGRVLRGSGRHTTRWTVARSSSWTFDEAPIAVVDVTVPHEGVLDDDSVAVLTVNGRPVGSWSLSGERTARRWVARLPPALWELPEWTFELEVLTQSADTDACGTDPDQGVFVVLEPTSRVEVVRTERLQHGLAGFSRATQHVRPEVMWQSELTETEWLNAGVLLSNVARETPNDRWSVRVHPVSPHVELAMPDQPWLDVGEWVALPQLDANTSPLMLAEDCDKGLCRRLDVTLGSTLDGMAVPDLSQMPAHGAVWTDRWVALDAGVGPLSDVERTFGPDPDSLSVQPSMEQSRAGMVNLVTGLLGLLVVIVGGVWTVRGRRRS